MTAPVAGGGVDRLGELPEPRGYAWLLNDGNTEFTEDEFCPVDPEDWSVASALYDADQMREYARAYRGEAANGSGWGVDRHGD